MGHLTPAVAEIRADVKLIKEKLNRQNGFVGGMLFAFTSIWAVAIAFVAYVWDRIGS